MNEPGKYSVIYADPPWQYRVWSKKGTGRSAESHYSTMSLEDIKALPVHLLAAGGKGLHPVSLGDVPAVKRSVAGIGCLGIYL